MQKIREVLDSYRNNPPVSESSFALYEPKIRRYVEFIGAENEIAISIIEENLRKFIFDSTIKGYSGKVLGTLDKFYAIKSFYDFVHIYSLNISKNLVPTFPIDINEIKRQENTRNRLLNRDFRLESLLDEKIYSHLNDVVAIKTILAAISLGISAGYNSGQLFPTNIRRSALRDGIMTINDYLENDDGSIKVTNFYQSDIIPFIDIDGKCGDIIKDYYFIREDFHNSNPRFFITMWDTKKVREAIVNSWGVREGHLYVSQLISYALKHASNVLGIDFTLEFSDLRINAMYQSLVRSGGRSLKNIIATFGYTKNTVQKVFEQYCNEDIDLDLFFPFEDKEDEGHFFYQTSSDEIKQSSDEVRMGLKISFSRFRQNKISRELKSIYENTCQICGTSFTLLPNLCYSEAHHIQPHGKPHFGDNVNENLIVLCPNHHALFDLGIIAIDPENLNKILHIDINNEIHNKPIKIKKHAFGVEHVKYHYNKFFLPLRAKLGLDT